MSLATVHSVNWAWGSEGHQRDVCGLRGYPIYTPSIRWVSICNIPSYRTPTELAHIIIQYLFTSFDLTHPLHPLIDTPCIPSNHTHPLIVHTNYHIFFR